MMSNELKPSESYPAPGSRAHTASHGSLGSPGQGDRVSSSQWPAEERDPSPVLPRVCPTEGVGQFLGSGHLAATGLVWGHC